MQPDYPNVDNMTPAMPALLTALLLASVGYQAVLCVVNANIRPISPMIVMAAEGIIYAALLLLIMIRIQPFALAGLALVFSYLLLLALVRGQFDFKSLRDLLIPFLFVAIGMAYGSKAAGDRVLGWLCVAVFTVGLLEWVFLERYAKFMDIYSYYVNQGSLRPDSQWVEGGTLALNGMRSDEAGRSILPGLFGNHRVSSIFLEPVSLGNFAAVVGAWGVSKGGKEWKKGGLFFLAALVMAVFSDSRYGTAVLFCMLAVRLFADHAASFLAIVLPVLCIGLLLAFAQSNGGMLQDNLPGRLAISGFTLANMGPAAILGVAENPGTFADMGYAYVLTRFGAPALVVLWIMLWLVPLKEPEGRRYRNLVCLHVAMILAVSGTSLFALKTAGILWFLFGCTVVSMASKERLASRPGRVHVHV